ncbi:MAG: 1-(5-phosphoribosyl)-5-[(5-phosphoribosylamino)methylideneamino]imidazole-4-carboxamide isomerase [Chloroflexi bacterium]|nr:1-(5-phosphoribosyl)-5-[(5-phosphoribosylamino)methylideneamino]imidazole-4-carboxamide isomerase [Chloroflexota bacterium]
MEVIPAIDLKGGRCVRLYQGDYGRETVYSEDPAGMAQHWQSLGAPRLHLVDLDGAAKGEPCHLALVGRIAAAVKVPVQVGGGIRSMETIQQLLDLGVQRVILGTAAAENPDLVREACRQFGQAIIVSVDARDGYVATRGWLEKTSVTASEMVRQMAGLGAKRFICTDIARDGTLTQPNFAVITELAASPGVAIIASGGVASVEHITRLSRLGVEGVIVGRALYTGDVKLEEALAALA